jgi:hypothetical protein
MTAPAHPTPERLEKDLRQRGINVVNAMSVLKTRDRHHLSHDLRAVSMVDYREVLHLLLLLWSRLMAALHWTSNRDRVWTCSQAGETGLMIADLVGGRKSVLAAIVILVANGHMASRMRIPLFTHTTGQTIE